MHTRMQQLLLPADRRIVAEGIEESGNLRKDAVFPGMARLYRGRGAEAQFIEYLLAGICRAGHCRHADNHCH